MKAKDLKQWQLFYNTNNYLCLVYKTTKYGAHIINYNGTFYTAKRASDYEYDDIVPEQTVKEFFENFPLTKVDYHEQRKQYEHIVELYRISNRVSMLILC